MKNSKRYVISLASGLFLAGLATLSVFFRLEGVASVCVAGIMTMLTSYIWGETKRPSKKQENETDQN